MTEQLKIEDEKLQKAKAASDSMRNARANITEVLAYLEDQSSAMNSAAGRLERASKEIKGVFIKTLNEAGNHQTVSIESLMQEIASGLRKSALSTV